VGGLAIKSPAFDPNNKFSVKSNEDILQLWRNRKDLKEDIDTLQMELQKRHLSREASDVEIEDFVDHPIRGSSFCKGIDFHQTYLNGSIILYGIRELWLRYKTKDGVPVAATTILAYHTEPLNKMAFRAEMLYAYEYEGKQFEGRVVRDYFFNHKAADSLANKFHPGEGLTVTIAPNRPELSYYPSGFGFIEAFTIGSVSLILAGLILTTVLLLLVGAASLLMEKLSGN